MKYKNLNEYFIEFHEEFLAANHLFHRFMSNTGIITNLK